MTKAANRIRQHRPGFVEIDEPVPEVAFETLDELLAIPFVAEWSKPLDGKPFHRFCVNDAGMLMAEFDGGRLWYVVGYLSHPLRTGLPIREDNDCAAEATTA